MFRRMIVSTIKETEFTQAFKNFIEGEKDPAMKKLREEAFAHFEATGFPTTRDEDWKYTNVAPISNFKFEISDLEAGPIEPDLLKLLQNFNYERNGFTALNLAFGRSQIIRIPKETSVAEPIEIGFAADVDTAIFPHIVVIAEKGCQATIVENYGSNGKVFIDAAVQVFVEDSASITHYRLQKDPPDAFNYGVTEVTVERGGSYNSTNINIGGGISRHDVEVKFVGEGGEAWVDGLYMLDGSQHHDTHSIIDHTVPNCTSHQTYKGVLNGSSRAVFNGKVFVRENAHGTDAEQQNKNLLLSNEARVDTKPQLEIFNDDVKCSHGATVGQLEDEELFYLLTRGLPESLARNLLTYGFAEEVINKIEIEAIKSELDAMVLNRLGTEI